MVQPTFDQPTDLGIIFTHITHFTISTKYTPYGRTTTILI